MAKPTNQTQAGGSLLGAVVAIAIGAVLGVLAAHLFPLFS
jgi:type II secretory pathway component PulJ